MTTPIQQKIRDKKRTAQQILDMVKPGEWIQPGSVGGDSTECMKELARRLGPGPGQLKNIELWNYAMFFPHPEFQQVDPQQEYHCFHEYFFFPWSRKARDTNNVTSWAQWGWALGMWFCHYRFVNSVKANRGLDWWWNAATPFDEHGFVNWSYGTNNCSIFAQCAKKTVVEVRSDYPWAEGGRFNTYHIDDIDYWVEVDVEKYKWPQINEKAIQAKPEEKKIAEHIMTIMRDRDNIQLGIGSLPSACVSAMTEAGFKDLGVHTEMLNAGLIKLIESGQVTNRYKNLPYDRGKSVWTFAFPVDVNWYYDTINRNQNLAVYDIGYTNNLHNLTRLDNMIAIDNCVAVDLLGQQCSGFYEKRPISSSGGYFQFVSFCAQSKGGRGVASMTSRSKHGTSRIVPFLPEGSSVDVPAQLANYVCTEYGIVNLRGLNGYERASALISIAHPDDRDWLEKEAKANGLLPPKFPVPMLPKEGGARRYPSHEERKNYKVPFHSDYWGYDWDPYQCGK
ncbi:MAG TPA: acetyl-CoA hydrolase/transferase C-terminal domain-containing protein [Syntrophales bacterium]|nr:acetyl-CoA hydrolase/transferase C-terminal domain-containing protein [Syntrophales bacterium]HQN79337.1 acetyl-CoA hydrolase/transferase C-terminal domain-containing protein [Syntrophales bacterium]HQQ28540.1 acetyl-CoA hydrolase/transferase C-terminal domain-containing protein [Syntrophales bacterium]